MCYLLDQGFLLDSESWNQLNGVNLEISMICGWSAVAVILICMSLAARFAVSID